MPTDAQTLCNLVATEGYEKLSKRALLECILAAMAAGGGGGACSSQSGIGSPVGVKTPAFIGQLYVDTSGPNYWFSTGLTAADWTVISGGAGNSVVFPSVTYGNLLQNMNLVDCAQQILLPNCTNMLANFSPNGSFISEVTGFSAPKLLTVNGNVVFDFWVSCAVLDMPVFQANTNGALIVTGMSVLTQINWPAFISSPSCNFVEIDDSDAPNSLLASISWPSLGATVLPYTIKNNPVLTTISVPNWLPANALIYDFSGNAFSATTVEGLLRRFVLAGVTTCTINLSGGTNAGLASLSPQGTADAATLGAQLTINP